HDRLLERDGRRFISEIPTPPPPRRTDRNSRIVRTIELGMPGSWRAAAVVGQAIVAAGFVDHRIVMKRVNFTDNRQDSFFVPWPKIAVRSDAALNLIADPTDGTTLGVYAAGVDSLPAKTPFKADDIFPDDICVGALPGTDRPSIAVARGQHGNVYSLGYDE